MNKVKIISVISAILLCFMFTVNVTASKINGISAEAAILMVAETGEVVYSKKSDVRMPMASTTKIMTAITVIEKCDTDMLFAIPKEACGIEGSSAYLKQGEKFTIKELLYALMLSSANDAATALAIATAGSIKDFSALMNEKAEDMGLKNTHFTNPHGLDDAEHYSSASDLAVIMAYAMKNELFREITATKTYTCTSEGNESRVFVNHNKLLNIYEDCNGGKTGFTKRCGRCLVSSAERNGLELICVTLNAPNDWQDHISMLDHGFESFEKLSLVSSGQYSYTLPVINGSQNYVKATAQPCDVIINKNNTDSIKAVCELDRFYYADIEKGEVLGNIVFYQGNKEIAKSKITAEKSVKSIKYKNFFQRILEIFR